MKPLLIIKLGGSVVTFKDSLSPKFRIETVKDLAKQIKTLSSKYQFILVHGAGSFGHPIAKSYNLTAGLKYESQKIGLSETSLAMIKLNQLVLEQFIKMRLPVISLPPHSFISMENKNVKYFDLKLIKRYLSLGFIPVLHGDGVLEEGKGISILSGDVIIPYLANNLKTEKVIFLTDVDGVFDKNPKIDKNAKLIKEINNDNFEEVVKGLSSHNNNDVTGEMAGKLLEIKEQFSGKEVIIANGLKENSLINIISGNYQGTLITNK